MIPLRLKLKKKSEGSQIAITLSEKESVVSRHFLEALALALALHLGLALLFHVSPIKIRWNRSSQMPIIVEAEPAKEEQALVNSNEGEKKIPAHAFLAKGKPQPTVPKTPEYSTPRFSAYIEEKSVFINPFSEMERGIYQPQSPLNSKAPSLPPISIVSSGLLAKQTIVNNGLKNNHRIDFKTLRRNEPHRLDYKVVIDSQTGTIIWYELSQKSNHRESNHQALEKMASSILENMQFTSDPNGFVTSGNLEIHFNADKKLVRR